MKKYIFLFFGVLVIGCSIPEKIGIPSWYTNLEFYFMNESFNSEDLELEYENVSIDSLGIVTFEEHSDDSQVFGPIEIQHPDEKETSIALSECSEIAFSGDMELTSFDIIPVIKELPIFDEFELITFDSGIMRVTVFNNTQVWAGDSPNNNPLKVDVMNGLTNEVFETVEFQDNDIPPGYSNFNWFELAGREMPNFVKLRFYGGSRGTDGEVFVDIDDEFIIQVDLEDVTAREVTEARIPDQELDEMSGSFETEISYPIIEGDFDLTGVTTIQLQFSSPISAVVEVDIYAYTTTDSMQLEHNTQEPILLQIQSGITDTTLSSNDYNINDLLETFPETLTYSCIATIGDTTQTYHLHMDNVVQMTIDINGDAEINTNNNSIWVVPTEDDEISISTEDSEDFDEEVYDVIDEATLNFRYLNTSGHEISAHILVADDSLKVFEEILNFDNTDTNKVQLFVIPQLEITEPGIYKNLVFSIEQSELDFFLADSVWIGTRFNVRSEGGGMLSGDISLIGKIGASVLIDENTFGDGE
jgi:hypothetical protein